MSKIRYSVGFTLLEAIVALVVLSGSGLALYAWLNTSMFGLIRANDTLELKLLADDLDAFFSTLNITEETSRAIRVNGYDVYWDARLVEPKMPGRHSTGALNMFELGLYDVDVRVLRDRYELGTYQTRLVGYKKVRELEASPL